MVACNAGLGRSEMSWWRASSSVSLQGVELNELDSMLGTSLR